jgi:hypothetical protein
MEVEPSYPQTASLKGQGLVEPGGSREDNSWRREGREEEKKQ